MIGPRFERVHEFGLKRLTMNENLFNLLLLLLLCNTALLQVQGSVDIQTTRNANNQLQKLTD